MQYDYTSVFPNGFDDRTFFCDVDIKNKPIIDAYNNLISQGKFTDANIFINSHNGIHNYSADLWNFIETKIKNTQEYLTTLEKYNPFHSTKEETPVGEFWIK